MLKILTTKILTREVVSAGLVGLLCCLPLAGLGCRRAPEPPAATQSTAEEVHIAVKVDQAEQPTTAAAQAELLSEVTISDRSFNPQAGQVVTIDFTLARSARVELAYYDPDFTQVWSWKSEGELAAGRRTVTWNGRDIDGAVVPDEAYFFTLTARDAHVVTDIYDPTAFSGGDGGDITQARVDAETRAITYLLPEAARVMIRLGVQDGPLLNTLVDWEPRVAGEITEHWDGRDRDDLIDLFEHPRFKMLITYFALPENSVITYGNKNVNYRTYKKLVRTERPAKSRPARPNAVLSPHYQLPRTADYAPALKLKCSPIKEGDETGVLVLQDKTVVTIDIEEDDKAFFINQQYEITLFLDNEFYAEQEMGYVPYNWVWDLSDVNAGDYILTVNVSGFKDQIGVISRRIRVAEPDS